MIAVDTGFLFALIDKSDAWHSRAVAALPTVQEGWITTWPVLTEATYLITSHLGTHFAQKLLEEVADGGLLAWGQRAGRQQMAGFDHDGLCLAVRQRRHGHFRAAV